MHVYVPIGKCDEEKENYETQGKQKSAHSKTIPRVCHNVMYINVFIMPFKIL